MIIKAKEDPEIPDEEKEIVIAKIEKLIDSYKEKLLGTD